MDSRAGDSRIAIASIESLHVSELPGLLERYGWVTIGADDSKPEGEKGGTPVQIGEGGEITKGPKSLKGKNVGSLGKKKKQDRQMELEDRPLFGGPQEPAEGPKKTKPTKEAIDDRLSQAIQALGPNSTVEDLQKALADVQKLKGDLTKPEPGPAVVSFDSLKTDPERFQYKFENVGAAGVTSEFAEVDYNPMLAGTLYTWHDPESGEEFVINGHHRHEIGARAGYKGSQAVFRLDAESPEEARAMGALINIAEGHGTALDAAKFIRDMGFSTGAEGMAYLASEDISLKGKVAADAILLSNLSDNLFREVTYGRFPDGWARAIGSELAPEENATEGEIQALYEAQNKLAKRLTSSKKQYSDKLVREMALMASLAPKQGKGQGSLFGDEDESEVLFEDRASVQSAVRDSLSKQVAAFGSVGVSGRAGLLEEAGVGSVDTEAAGREKQKAANMRDVFDREIRFRGGIGQELNSVLNRAAEEHNNARNQAERNAVKQRAVDAIGAVLSAAETPGESEGDGEEGREDRTPMPGQRDMFARRKSSWREFYGRRRGWLNELTGEILYSDKYDAAHWKESEQ